MSGVVARRWLRNGALTDAGWLDGEPSERELSAQRACVDSANWTVELAYSQATVETLRAQLEAAEAETARLGELERVNDMFRTFVIGEGAYERFCALQARAEAAEAEVARVADELSQMRDSWVVPTAGKPSSRRIATINEAGTMRAEDDFDNEVWALRKCAADLDKVIYRLDPARKEAAP